MPTQLVITGDALTELKQLRTSSFDVVVTSPPWNIGVDYGVYDDTLPYDSYLDWIESVFHEVERVMKPLGSLFLNVGFVNKSPWLAFDIASRLRKFMVLQNQIVWVKSIHVDDKTYGHFKPMNSKRFVNNNYEYVFHFTKRGDIEIDRHGAGIPYAHKQNVRRWNNTTDIRCRGNTWFIPYDTLVREPETGLNAGVISTDEWFTVSEAGKIAGLTLAIITMAVDAGQIVSNGERRRLRRICPISLQAWLAERKKPKNHDHPAIFPWKLPQMCIQLHGVRPKMKVLDPFVGHGSTLVACQKLKINGLGIEIDPDCAATARKRIGEG